MVTLPFTTCTGPFLGQCAAGARIVAPPAPATEATDPGAAPVQGPTATQAPGSAPDEPRAQHLAAYTAWAHRALPVCRPVRRDRPGPFSDSNMRFVVDYLAARRSQQEAGARDRPQHEDAWQTRADVHCRACGEVIRGATCGTPGEPLHFGCWQASID